MFELRIETATVARDLLDAAWSTCAVSLIGDTLRFPLTSYGGYHLVLNFDDTEVVDDPLYVSPRIEHIRAVLAHTAHLTDADRLLVHCHAGKSRSTAMAIGILIQHGMSPTEAFEAVRTIRPMLIPNRLMIALLDDEMGLEGALNGVVADYYAWLPMIGVTLPGRGGWNL